MITEILVGGVVILFILLILLVKQNSALKQLLAKLQFDKQSQSVRYGKMTEQFMPFLERYPYDSQQFRFLGTPIDGVQFSDDKIIFVEFKTGKAKMSDKQQRIKRLVDEKKVSFEEISIK